MRKQLLTVVVLGLLAILPAPAPRAAIVELLVDATGAFTIQNSLSVGIGAVDIAATGATGFTLNPLNTGISPADSVFNPDIGDGTGRSALIVNNPVNGVSIAPAGALSLIGTFARVADPNAFSIIASEELFGGTVFDPDLNVLHPTSIEAGPLICGEPPCVPGAFHIVLTFVPEPGIAIALALAALTLVGARKLEL